MIVADTSVWVDHFRTPDPVLGALAADGEVALHPFVFGELLLGGLPAHDEATDQLLALARCPVASAEEASAFIRWAELAGTGVGYVDTHLLMSARLLPEGKVMTRDKRLRTQAKRLGVAYGA